MGTPLLLGSECVSSFHAFETFLNILLQLLLKELSFSSAVFQFTCASHSPSKLARVLVSVVLTCTVVSDRGRSRESFDSCSVLPSSFRRGGHR